MTLQIVSRDGWGARQATRAGTVVPGNQRKGFVVHHNGPAMRLVDDRHGQRCVNAVKAIQTYHMLSKRWSDVAYSYLLCPHGVVYEGRGALNQFANGADTVAPVDPSEPWVTVCVLVGTRPDGTHEQVGVEVFDALYDLRDLWLAYGMGLRVVPHGTGPDGKPGPAGAFKVKPCPGDQLIAWCEQWNNRRQAEFKPDLKDTITMWDSETGRAYLVFGGHLFPALSPAERDGWRAGGSTVWPLSHAQFVEAEEHYAEHGLIIKR